MNESTFNPIQNLARSRSNITPSGTQPTPTGKENDPNIVLVTPGGDVATPDDNKAQDLQQQTPKPSVQTQTPDKLMKNSNKKVVFKDENSDQKMGPADVSHIEPT